MNSLKALQQFGQSIWYDNIQRNMLGPDGELLMMIEQDGLAGVTSNPSIFEKAIAKSTDYDEQITALVRQQSSISSKEIFVALAVDDIQHAADLLRPVYERTNGVDGYVSLEVSPDLAYDANATIDEAKQLVSLVNRANLMIKVPCTKEGVIAIEELTASGVNVNATLLFSTQRYEEVANAYIRGLQRRVSEGADVNNIASVASFFISRVDTLVDQLLEEKRANADEQQKALIDRLIGRAAILNAKEAYGIFQNLYASGFDSLRQSGAHPQRLLWASSGTKNPSYSDILYLESLIGSETVNTVPPATYKAYLDHGEPKLTLTSDIEKASENLLALETLGIDMAAVTQQLEQEGVVAFQTAFNNLLNAIEAKAAHLAA